MTLGAKKYYFTFLGVFLSLLTPMILYIADIFHFVIPISKFWTIIYIFGVIPAILTDGVLTFLHQIVQLHYYTYQLSILIITHFNNHRAR